MNLCGSVEARRIHRTFCASFLWEASGRGIAFCHTHVAFCFKTDEKREQSGCQARGDRLLLSFFVPPVFSFHSLQCAEEAKL